MAYALPTFVAGQVLTAADLEKLNDSIEYLLTPNYQFVTELSGTYTTSSTSYTNVGSNYAVSLTTHGGRVVIQASGYLTVSGAAAYTLTLGLALDGAVSIKFATLTAGYFSVFHVWTPAAGAHTIALQWKVSNVAATATMDKAIIPCELLAIER